MVIKEPDRTLFPVTEAEMVAIMKAHYHLTAAFGTGGVALIWNEDEPMPGCVQYLMLLRGISNENMDGAGI